MIKMETGGEVDLVNRDPNAINTHIQVAFEDVLGEPEHIRSIDCVWRNSFKCFNLWKHLCYTICSVLCGLCMAMSWGCVFAQIAFTHIWYITPCIRLLEINCGPMKRVLTMCLNCCLTPICESIGSVFNAFKRS